MSKKQVLVSLFIGLSLALSLFGLDLAEARPAAIASETHPNQNSWYSNRDLVASWSRPEGVINFSYTLSNPETDRLLSQDNIEDTGLAATDLSDGIWTLTLRSNFPNRTETSVFTVKIDTEIPTSPEVTIRSERRSDQFPTLVMSSVDSRSGVDRYEVAINGGDPIVSRDEELQLEKQRPGNLEYSIVAIDRAGNRSEPSKGSHFIEGIKAPVITHYPNLIAVLQPIVIRGIAKYSSAVQLYVDGEIVAEFFVSEHLSELQERKLNGFSADEEVEWAYSLEGSLSSGTKQINASQTTVNGEESYLSEGVEVKVLAAWVSLGGINISTTLLFWIVLLLLILAIILSGAIQGNSRHKWRGEVADLKNKVNEDIKELADSNRVSRESIEIISKEIDQDFEELTKS